MHTCYIMMAFAMKTIQGIVICWLDEKVVAATWKMSLEMCAPFNILWLWYKRTKRNTHTHSAWNDRAVKCVQMNNIYSIHSVYKMDAVYLVGMHCAWCTVQNGNIIFGVSLLSINDMFLSYRNAYFTHSFATLLLCGAIVALARIYIFLSIKINEPSDRT